MCKSRIFRAEADIAFLSKDKTRAGLGGGAAWELRGMMALLDGVVERLSKLTVFQHDLDYHLIRVSMIFIFALFGWSKWHVFEAETIRPLIAHSPLVFWLLPAFGVRGAGWFLGATEWTFGFLLFLGFWNKSLGIFGAAGSLFTYASTTSIILFLPDAWAPEAGGFPSITMTSGFLAKDIVLFAASFYLLKQDIVRLSNSYRARNYKNTVLRTRSEA